MNVKDAITNRRSIRKFKDKEVSMETLGEILEIAKWTPSASNLQNWKFIVVKEQSTKEKIADLCFEQNWMQEAPVFIIVCNDYKPVVEQFDQAGKLYSIQNCAAVTMNILLAAEELGLNTCWVGGFEPRKLGELLKIPDNIDPEAVIVLGYGDEKPEIPPRNDINTLSFFEKWKGKAKFEPKKVNPLLKKIKDKFKNEKKNV